MSTPQILINSGNYWFEFSKSKTGQLDYEGLWQNTNLPNVKGYQKITSSNYFSPGWYTYLQDKLNNNIKVYAAPEVDVSDVDLFAFLTHVGPFLVAVEAKDSLLAGELYLRRRSIFDSFAPLTQYIMEPLSVEILFGLVYGRMKNIDAETIPLIFNSAKKKLGFDASKESLDQAYVRYFKENTVSLVLPLVGTQYHEWDPAPYVLNKLTDNLGCENLLEKAAKIRQAKHDLYEALECSVQAEPYNEYDKNSIVVSLENITSKITGNPGLENAGHIRAAAAKIIREAKLSKMNYNGRLASLSRDTIAVWVNV